ncbi:hypothetical protein D3C71_1232940 [compost metagenome]
MARIRPEIEAPCATARQRFGGAGTILGPPGIVVVVMVSGNHAEGQAAAGQDRDRAVGDVPFLASVEVLVFALGVRDRPPELAVAVLDDVAHEGDEGQVLLFAGLYQIAHLLGEGIGAARLRQGDVGVVLGVGNHGHGEDLGPGRTCRRQQRAAERESQRQARADPFEHGHRSHPELSRRDAIATQCDGFLHQPAHWRGRFD